MKATLATLIAATVLAGTAMADETIPDTFTITVFEGPRFSCNGGGPAWKDPNDTRKVTMQCAKFNEGGDEMYDIYFNNWHYSEGGDLFKQYDGAAGVKAHCEYSDKGGPHLTCTKA